MRGREIRKALHEGRLVYSTSAASPSTYWPQLVQQAGVDFVFLDTEHTPIGRETMAWMCQAYAGRGIPPVVRLPRIDAYEAAKVLDGGAQGIIAPYVESADHARELVGAVRWRPLKGRRLEEALDDPDQLEPELRTYLEDRNGDLLLIGMIESVPGIENLDEILSVSGLDCVFIGPHDLSCSLGIPEQYWHEKFDAAVRTIFSKAREYNVGAGIHWWEDRELELEWSRAGGNLIMHSSDVSFFGAGLKRELEEIREALGDSRGTQVEEETPVI
jgi:4-hydroxy-2-oxoheptanedioate aldolase